MDPHGSDEGHRRRCYLLAQTSSHPQGQGVRNSGPPAPGSTLSLKLWHSNTALVHSRVRTATDPDTVAAMNEIEDDSHAWGARLGALLPWIRSWEQRNDPDPIESGSPLARDDEDYPRLPTSTLAWVGLTTASEHLTMVADILEGESPKSFPTAYQTLCRTVMLGAGQAVWLMTGNARERLHRSRLIAADERWNYRQFLNDWVKDDYLTSEVSSTAVQEAQKRIQDLDAEKRTLEGKMKDSGWSGRDLSFAATRMLRDVANHMAAQPPNGAGAPDEWLRINGSWQWRMGSGDAHARLWPRLVRPGERIPLLDGSKTRLLISTGSLEQIGVVVGTAVLTTQEGFRLWDERRRAPAASESR